MTAGLPTLDLEIKPVSHFEFWPACIFYAPLWLWAGLLALRYRGLRLPLIANPSFPAGGLVGEEKSALFPLLAGPERKRLPAYLVVRRTAQPISAQHLIIEAQMKAHGLAFPLVAKPDIGCRGAGVRPIRTIGDLEDYLRAFPDGARFILQKMVEAEGEAGVFYVRRPGEARGQIISLTLKYFPKVTGDGISALRELILNDPRAGKLPWLYLNRLHDRLHQVPAVGEVVPLVFSGSHSKGAVFRNGNAFITEAMSRRFDQIADGIDGFHFGRLDVRFADFEAFRQGEDFSIIEFNGAGAESTHIWDSRTTLLEAWRALFRQYALLFRIGSMNRALGCRPETWRSLLHRWSKERALTKCYPSTQ